MITSTTNKLVFTLCLRYGSHKTSHRSRFQIYRKTGPSSMTISKSDIEKTVYTCIFTLHTHSNSSLETRVHNTERKLQERTISAQKFQLS